MRNQRIKSSIDSEISEDTRREHFINSIGNYGRTDFSAVRLNPGSLYSLDYAENYQDQRDRDFVCNAGKSDYLSNVALTLDQQLDSKGREKHWRQRNLRHFDGDERRRRPSRNDDSRLLDKATCFKMPEKEVAYHQEAFSLLPPPPPPHHPHSAFHAAFHPHPHHGPPPPSPFHTHHGPPPPPHPAAAAAAAAAAWEHHAAAAAAAAAAFHAPPPHP